MKISFIVRFNSLALGVNDGRVFFFFPQCEQYNANGERAVFRSRV